MVAAATALTSAAVLSAGAKTYEGNQAASAQRQAAASASNTEQNALNTTEQNFAPYLTTGDNALTSLNALNTPGSNQNAWLQSTPGYNFAQTQGLKAVQNSAAARGLGVSGAAQKGAASYATGLASGTYQQQFGNALAQAQLGENATAGVGNAITGTAAQQGSNMIGSGNATANAALNAGSALSGALNTGSNALLLQSLNGGGAGQGGLYQPTQASQNLWPGYTSTTGTGQTGYGTGINWGGNG